MSEQQTVVKECISEGCNNTFECDPTATVPRSFCDDCRARRADASRQQVAETRRAKIQETKAIVKKNKLTKAEQKEAAFNNPNPVKEEDDIRAILIEERGLQNKHVIETVMDLGRAAAELNKIVPNRFYWLNGHGKMSEALKTGEPTLLDPVSNDQAKGMVISTSELFALYDYGISWRDIRWPLNAFEEFRDLPWDFSALIERFTEKKRKRITFEEFHGLRYCSIVDSLWAGRWVHEKDFWPKPHGEWKDFFIKKIPSLPMDYGMEDIKKWFKGLTDGPRRFLLVASRNSYKSSWQVVAEAIPFVLACPDVTILEISAVKNLSKKFIKSFRKYWTIEDSRKPSIFAQLWPEMMIHADDQSDSNTFISPMSKGLYPQPTMASSSVDSSQVGERCWVLVLDDCADEENEATPELREKLVEKVELIEKLKEPQGIELIFGTPQAAEGDLYKTIQDRSAKTGHKYLDYRIDPAWTLKPEAVSKNIHDVVEDDVQSLLFPSRMNFEFLKAELENGSEKTFRRQNLCQWIDDSDPSLVLHFDRAMLESARVTSRQVPEEGNVCIVGDLAFTMSPYRDASSFTITKSVGDVLYVLLQSTGHWSEGGKAEEIVRLARTYPAVFDRCFLEKYSGFEGLEKEIRLVSARYGMKVPVFWVEPSHGAENKFRRLKNNVELAISQGKIKFVIPNEGEPDWIEALILELLKLDGSGPKRRSSSIKDDRGDSLSLAVRFLLKSAGDQDTEELRRLAEKAEEDAARRRLYKTIHGVEQNSWMFPTPPSTPEAADFQQSPNDNPVYRILQQGGLVTDPDKKTYGFDFMRKIPHDLKR